MEGEGQVTSLLGSDMWEVTTYRPLWTIVHERLLELIWLAPPQSVSMDDSIPGAVRACCLQWQNTNGRRYDDYRWSSRLSRYKSRSPTLAQRSNFSSWKPFTSTLLHKANFNVRGVGQETPSWCWPLCRIHRAHNLPWPNLVTTSYSQRPFEDHIRANTLAPLQPPRKIATRVSWTTSCLPIKTKSCQHLVNDD